MNDIIPGSLALMDSMVGFIQTIQAALQSSGLDCIMWPIFLIVEWCALLARTNPILKFFSLPLITISSYFVLYISYRTILSVI
jgi:hypothetical protein